MVKKEFRDILKPALNRSFLLLLLPFSYFLDSINLLNITGEKSYLYLFCGTFIAMTLWIASTYGIDAFRFEHQDNSLEYLLSLPISRLKIILNKMIPRIFVITIFIVMLEIIAGVMIQSRLRFLDTIIYFSFWIFLVVSFFLFGFSVSLIEVKHFRLFLNIFIVFCFFHIAFGIAVLLKSTFDSLSTVVISLLGYILSSIIVNLILGISFASTYRNFDLKSLKLHGKRFTVKVMVPLFILSILGILLSAKNGVF